MNSQRPFWLSIFVTLALAVLVLKLLLAFLTTGAADISVWKDFVAHINECGVCVYRTGGMMQYPGGSRLNPFNHPPFIIHFLRFIDFVSLKSGLAFPVVFRSVTSLIDIGSIVVLYKILQRENAFNPLAFSLYILAPATIVISGYHGNTDTVMLFFVLLAALFISKPWLAGAAFGMALNIKIVPVIFLAAFLLKYRRANNLRFLGAVLAVFILGSLPFLLQEPVAIGKGVIGYAGFSGRWGLSRALFGLLGPSSTYELITRVSAYLLLLYIFYLSWKTKHHPLTIQLGLIVFTFLAFTPAWGTNYMPWLDPFAIRLGAWQAAIYYSMSGAMLIYLYFVSDDESTRLIGLCWITVLVITWLFLRRTRGDNKAEAEEGSLV
jgi:hypothetical protein